MPPLNLKALISEHPENKRALLKLAAWLNKAGYDVITPRRLAREVPLDSKALADALTILVDAGVLRMVYKVTTPSGALADPEYNDPTEIPPEIADRWENYFNTDESDVVPVFKRVA